MPHERFYEWYEGVREKEFIMGECNCDDCAPPIDLRQYVLDALDDMYGIPKLPRAYDPDFNFLRRDVEARQYKGNKIRMWKSILASVSGRYHATQGIVELHPERIRCGDCGRVVPADETEMVDDGTIVCKNCLLTYYIHCDLCGNTRPHQGKTFLPDNKVACRPCSMKAYTQCFNCGTPLDEDEAVDIYDLVGEPNYDARTGEGEPSFNWHRCTWEFPDEYDIEKPGSMVCQSCNDRLIVPCEQCGEAMYRPHAHRIAGDVDQDIKVCGFCFERLNVVKRYDYACKPMWLTSIYEPTRTKDGLFYGIELEVEYVGEWHTKADGTKYRQRARTKEQVGRKALDWWGGQELYIKHDGTLDLGFEIVSHPFTWGHYLDNHHKWTDFHMYLRELGFSASYYSHQKEKYTCGFHVHMSKNAFTRMHLFKFVKFFYKASTRALIEAIAERHDNKYSKFRYKDYSEAVKVGKEKNNMSQKRFSAINLMGGHAHRHGHAPKECNTAEIRIFQGSLEPYRFHRNMEFLESLYEFTLQSSPKELMVRNYVDYLTMKGEHWRHLLNFIKYDPKINKAYAYISKMMKGV